MLPTDHLQLSRHRKSIRMKRPVDQDSLPSLDSSSSSPTLSSIATDSSKRHSLLDHSHLKPGHNASLLSYSQTIQMYQENAKKTNNMDVLYDFATFLAEGVQQVDDIKCMLEAEKILKQTSLRGHGQSQYYLANMYAAGSLNQKHHQPEFEKSLPLYLQSAKHHHPDAAFRAARCYEKGLGTRKDKAKATQFYRKAATLSHPGAMFRLGTAYLKGQLNLSQNIRDGYKWLKRSVEAATPQYPHALHELAILHERGVDSIIFVDHAYALGLYRKAADEMGHAPSAYRLGECHQLGLLGCQINPELALQYYQMAADQLHPEACLALTGLYLIGIPYVLTPSDDLAYQWALRATEQKDASCSRAEYMLGYLLENGIGVEMDIDKAMEWYQRAAEHGEERAIQRLSRDKQNERKRSSLLLFNEKRLSLLERAHYIIDSYKIK
ncbi:Protein SKT5 [Choanephora cucurbitarum]|uniref:Protein SKT5 n=1 Tax=Choanephora cucurbitarum TaxID=101091 RepID=A0A1C7NGG4_9FUNG|nr:Protein SKT5 [Choanephora cucurbitarum]OBZ88192.1 Protein SKT5 [Choanephora cucurbitarum]